MSEKVNKILESSDVFMRDILLNNRYEVPHYQRYYTWSEDKLKSFVDDVLDNDKGFFIGLMIFSPLKQGYYEVVDGQQRLISISIIFSVLRDLSKKYNLKAKSGDKLSSLLEKFISDKDDDGYFEPKVSIQSEKGSCFYNENIIKEFSFNGKLQELDQESFLICKNYRGLYSYIDNIIKDLSNSEDKSNFISNLRDKIKSLLVVRLEISKQEDCYEVFETVNAKGEDLSSSDKIKNLIFKNINKSKSEKDILNKEWIEISSSMYNHDINMAKLIRYYWLSKNKKIGDKDLYKEINNKYKTSDDYRVFFHSLKEYSKIFEVVMSPTKENLEQIGVGVAYSSNISKVIRSIKDMNVIQPMVLIVAMLENKKCKNKELYETLKYLERFCFAYFKICHYGGNGIETMVSKLSLECNKPNSSFRQDFQKEMQEKYPADEEIESKIREALIYNEKMRRPLLNAISNSYEFTEGASLTDFTIEHIVPQSPNKDSNLTKKQVSNYVNRLGNLTLLEYSLNQSAGNKLPHDKTIEFNKSGFKENNQINVADWDITNYEYNIEQRELVLLDKIKGYYFNS